MFATLLAVVGLSATSQAVALKSHIVSASIFKPGLVLIVREVTIPAGKARYKVDFLPDALDGSFWFGGEGVKIDEVQTTLRFTDEKFTVKAKTIPDYLAANVGKTITLFMSKSGPGGGTEPVTGVLVDFGGPPYGGITLQLPNGNLRTINLGSVTELKTAGLSATTSGKRSKPVQEIAFEADSPKTARVAFITLEIGAAWTSSYSVSLVDDATATISSKAQIAVGPFRFENTTVNAVAGLPNLPTVLKFDLAAGYGSLQAYLKGDQDSYRQYRPGAGDPYTLLAGYYDRARQAMIQGQYYQGYGGGSGGYGGGGFGNSGGSLGYDPTDNSLIVRGRDADDASGREDQGLRDRFAVARVEDVYAYPLGKLSMEPGDRITRMLINSTAGYQRVYRWGIEEGKSSRVVKLIRLKNDGKLPWTGGKCMVMKKGMPLAQIDMPYTAPGQEANLELGEAQDIATDRESREIGRDTVTDLFQRNFVAVTVEESLLVTNTRPEAVKIEVRYSFLGQTLKAEGATIHTSGERLDAWNVNSDLTWTFDLKPGEKRVLSLTRKRVLL